MKKVGDYWLPDQDLRWGSNRRKSMAAYKHGGRGEQIHHLADALTSVTRRTTAIDAGANIGVFVRLLADHFDHVIAIEPAADAADCLRRNVADWGVAERVTLHEVAVSDHAESVRMEGRRDRRTVTRHVEPGGDIPARPIDSLGATDVAFLKLDVEGYEERALLGAKETIMRDRPIIMMEVKEATNSRYGSSYGSHELLVSFGYQLLRKIGEKEIDWLYAPV
ncbi:FkbM family methyltransferase [Acuticoccus yangtzensis]|uniref:FkbM family methyltransferase n=1 Tax=Acuticoccus yangtzensis TaxID=1443441 RepID=UPI0009499D2A|nr:FkbM family methyltransferase [Acuticoccus yangtzensis]